MAEKEKFDRSLEHVNIGTIGHVDHQHRSEAESEQHYI